MNTHLRTLLILVRNNTDVSYLTEQGFTFAQISRLFSEAVSDGFLIFLDGKFVITDAGMKMLEDVVKHGAGVQGRWILPVEYFRSVQISEGKVFLPKIKDSFFLPGTSPK